MGFLSPDVPEPQKPPNPASLAVHASPLISRNYSGLSSPSSLISTSAQGLKRKASTVKTSLLGGG